MTENLMYIEPIEPAELFFKYIPRSSLKIRKVKDTTKGHCVEITYGIDRERGGIFIISLLSKKIRKRRKLKSKSKKQS